MYYLLINGERTGPYTAMDVQQFVYQGAIGFETQFWKDGMLDWETIGASRHLFGLGSAVAQASYHNPTFPLYPQQPITIYPQPVFVQPVIVGVRKSRAAFVLLGLFLGGLGIHNFYAG